LEAYLKCLSPINITYSSTVPFRVSTQSRKKVRQQNSIPRIQRSRKTSGLQCSTTTSSLCTYSGKYIQLEAIYIAVCKFVKNLEHKIAIQTNRFSEPKSLSPIKFRTIRTFFRTSQNVFLQISGTITDQVSGMGSKMRD